MAKDLVTFSLQVGGRRYEDAGKGLHALAQDLGQVETKFPPVVKREMRVFLEGVTEALAQRHGNPYPGGTGPKSLSSRSGKLVESIRDSVFVKGDSLSNIVGEIGGIFYARVHEYGATIVPKRAKYLTIPLPAALNANGTPIKQSAKDWANTFIITSKKGNLLIVKRDGRKITPLYVLKTSVKIPARLNLRTTFDAGLPAWVDDLGDQLVKALVLKK